jgi:Mlc titration factor MtfA (ptsG expression regulator)
VFSRAFEHFSKRVENWEYTPIDDYAAESPGEFFAVIREAFIEIPQVVRDAHPEVYAQLVRFDRQDPVQRLTIALSAE